MKDESKKLPEQIENAHAFELYFSEGKIDLGTEEDNLVWKDILREGEWSYRPGVGQKPINAPLKVIADGPARNGEISMSEIEASFNDGAIEHVTVPTSHADKAHENTGYVRKLRRQVRDGKQYLQAGIEFTELDIKGKCERGSIANTSSGIVFDHINKETGRKYGQVLGHVALTNKPWLNGMTPFGMSQEFSDEEIIPVVEKDSSDSEESQEGAEDGSVVGPDEGEEMKDNKNTENKEETTTPSDPKVVLSEEARNEILEEAKKAAKAELSQELETERNKNKLLGSTVRELSVDKRIKELNSGLLSEHPGALAKIRGIMLSDEGDKILSLSEEVDGETKTVDLSATQIVEEILGSLPQKDGKLDMSTQAEQSQGGGAPPVETKKTDLSEEEAADLLAEELGLPSEYLSGKTKKDGE